MRDFLQTWAERLDSKLEKLVCTAVGNQEHQVAGYANAPRTPTSGVAGQPSRTSYEHVGFRSSFCEHNGGEHDPAAQLERIRGLLEHLPAKVADAVDSRCHSIGRLSADPFFASGSVPTSRPSAGATTLGAANVCEESGGEQTQVETVKSFTDLSERSSRTKAMRQSAKRMTDIYNNSGDISRSSLRGLANSKLAQGGRRCSYAWCNDHLQKVSFTLILLNTIYMAIETETRMNTAVNDEAPPRWLWYGNVWFAIAFAIELLWKLMLYRRDFFRENCGWNVFDGLLVFCSIGDVVFEFLNISFLRGLRVVRAVRATRALQTIHYVQQLRLMVASLISSLPSLAWAFVLLFLLLYLFALLIMQGVEDHMRNHGVDENLQFLYGRMASSVLTLFMAISGGKDWADCADPLRQVSPIYVLVFVAFETFVVFGVLNILTAVFIEASRGIIDVDRDLVVQRHKAAQESTLKHLQKLFEDVDHDKTGRISKNQIQELFESEETVALLQTIGLETAQAHDLIQLLEVEGDKDVDIGEFVFNLMRVRGWAKGTDVATAEKENKRMFRHLSQNFDKVTWEFCKVSQSLETLSARMGPQLSIVAGNETKPLQL